MKVIASILLNALEPNICEFLLPSFSQKIIIWSDILLNSILLYPNKNIVNNHVDYKSIFILVTQKKGMWLYLVPSSYVFIFIEIVGIWIFTWGICSL